jgi:hypothetical protein
VQTSTGSDVGIFFLVFRPAYIATGSGFFNPFYRYSSPSPLSRELLNFYHFQRPFKAQLCAKFKCKIKSVFFSHKRVTDPRVVFTGGAPLGVVLPLIRPDPILDFKFFLYLFLVNFPFNRMVGSQQTWYTFPLNTKMVPNTFTVSF